MYLIFKNDGSLLRQDQTDYIMQGSNNVNKIFIGFETGDYAEWAVSGIFTLPNGETITQPSEVAIGGFDFQEKHYNGWVILLTSDITKYDGNIELSISLNADNYQILKTYKTNITINKTGYPLDGEWYNNLTYAQYNSYLAQMSSYQVKYLWSNVRHYETLAKAEEELTKLDDKQLVFIDGDNRTIDAYYKFDDKLNKVAFGDNANAFIDANIGWQKSSENGYVEFTRANGTSFKLNVPNVNTSNVLSGFLSQSDYRNFKQYPEFFVPRVQSPKIQIYATDPNKYLGYQLFDLNNANGVPQLDANGKIQLSQLPANVVNEIVNCSFKKDASGEIVLYENEEELPQLLDQFYVINNIYAFVKNNGVPAWSACLAYKAVSEGSTFKWQLQYDEKFPTTILPASAIGILNGNTFYVDFETDKLYRYYVSGSKGMTEVSSSLELGYTSTTAYPGDKGQQNATDIADLKTKVTTITLREWN